MYYEIVISPSAAGFGEYQTQPIDGEGWADLSDLLAACAGNVGELYELGVDALPVGAQDIRGRIHGEPEHIYCYEQADGIAYFGVTETRTAPARRW